jgi:molecular chaperone Hsp33
VVLDDNGRVAAAGGVLVQALPDGDPASVREVQHALRTGYLHQLLVEGERSARALAERVSQLAGLEQIGEERPVRFQCRCSKERIDDMLQLLTTIELDEMIAEGRPTEIICNFCNTHYQVSPADLERIRSQVAGGPRQAN